MPAGISGLPPPPPAITLDVAAYWAPSTTFAVLLALAHVIAASKTTTTAKEQSLSWLPRPWLETAHIMPPMSKAMECIRATYILVPIRTRRFSSIWSVRRGRATVATEVHTLRCEKARPARYTEGESDAMLVVTSRATAASTAECFLMECP